MKRIIYIVLGVCFILTGCTRLSAQDVLRAELDCAVEEAAAACDDGALLSGDTVRALLQDFSYEIVQCEQHGDTAAAIVKVTNIDMVALAADFELEAGGRLLSGQQLDGATVTDIFKQLLEKNQYPKVTTEVSVQFTFSGGAWISEYDDNYYTALFGGFVQAFAS